MKRSKVFLCMVPALFLMSFALTPGTAHADDTIFDIQLGLYDEDEPVSVDSVLVTGVGFWGFFVQEPAPSPDWPEWRWSGIWVYSASHHLGDLKRGDLVNLDGIYQEYVTGGSSLSEIDISSGSYEVVSSGNTLPDPVDVLITEINDQGVDAEPYEGVLVRVDRDDNSLWSGPENEFEEWYLYTDGVGAGDSILVTHISADPEGDFEYETPPVGSELTFVQGPLNEEYDNYLIAPRSCEEDIGGPCKPSLSAAYSVTNFGLGAPVAGVNVQFTVNVDEETGGDSENYELATGIAILSASRDAGNHKIVHLTVDDTDPLFIDGDPEQVIVSGVKSESGGLTMDPNQTSDFRMGITPISKIQGMGVIDPGVDDASPLFDEVVTIQGRVTAKDGATYYYLQQGDGGPWHEMYVRVAVTEELGVGDSIEVAGEVREYFGSTQLGFRVGVNHTAVLGPASDPVNVTDVTADQIIYNSFTTGNNAVEPYESILLKLSSAVADSAPDSTTVFGEWFLIQMPDTAKCDLGELIDSNVFYQPCVGDLLDMTGVLRYAFVEYRILPRGDADINLIESGCPTSVPEDYAADRSRVWLASPKPNPFAPRTALRFNLPERGRVGLAVYGVNGRLVRTLVRDSTMEAGVYNLVWDGRNGSGEKMPSGLYLVRLKTPLEERSEKLMLIR